MQEFSDLYVRPLSNAGCQVQNAGPWKSALMAVVFPVMAVSLILSEGLSDTLFAASGDHLVLTASSGNQVAVLDDPSLTVQLMHNISAFTQWVLDIRFSEPQRQQFNQMLKFSWTRNDREAITGGIVAAVIYQMLPTINEVQRLQLQQQLKNNLLTSLYSDSNNPGNKWLLQIYREHHLEEALPTENYNAHQAPPTENANDGLGAFKNWSDSNRQFNSFMNNPMIFPSLR